MLLKVKSWFKSRASCEYKKGFQVMIPSTVSACGSIPEFFDEIPGKNQNNIK